MQYVYTQHKGFSLVELLVAMSVIGVLATIILVSVNSARQNAKDTAVKEDVGQLAKLMNLNYIDYASFTNLQPGKWLPENGTCVGLLTTGNYAEQAQKICLHILKQEPAAQDYALYLGNSIDNARKFSIMARLPSNLTVFWCSGSSGNVGKGSSGNSWVDPGCASNP